MAVHEIRSYDLTEIHQVRWTLASYNICRKLLQSYQSVVANSFLYAVVCWEPPQEGCSTPEQTSEERRLQFGLSWTAWQLWQRDGCWTRFCLSYTIHIIYYTAPSLGRGAASVWEDCHCLHRQNKEIVPSPIPYTVALQHISEKKLNWT